jgi:hypothetical protein
MSYPVASSAQMNISAATQLKLNEKQLGSSYVVLTVQASSLKLKKKPGTFTVLCTGDQHYIP